MISRKIYLKLKKNIDRDEILLLYGPRQSGKTTLLKKLENDLITEGKKTIFLNLDNEIDFKRLDTQQDLINYLKLHLGAKEKSYVFIDEIQRKENAGLFIKGIYDQNLPFKFILSGSGSVELKEKVKEGLAGRQFSFELNTISFKEFIEFKTNTTNTDYFKFDQTSSNLLNEYLRFGGYPAIVLEETLELKQNIIKSILDSFIDKDLKELLNISNTSAILDILTILSANIGNLTNFSDLANRININYKTLKNYIYYLEKIFVLYKITPFFNNPTKEITKSPVFYFKDLGMRNYILNRMSHFDLLLQGSFLFENLILRLLVDSKEDLKINYWRTKDQAEVDFVIKRGVELIPLEVKYSNLDNVNVSRSLLNFINKYQPQSALVVNLNFQGERKIGKTHVKFKPYYELIWNSVFNV